MDTMILSNYEKLNAQGRHFVECALNAVLKNPACLLSTPPEKISEIERESKKMLEARKTEREHSEQLFDEIKADCEGFTKEDYIARLSEVFSTIETYKVRYFYLFTMGKLGCDVKGGEKL
jgi:hypothetical protein